MSSPLSFIQFPSRQRTVPCLFPSCGIGMYNAVGADIIRPREADSLPYEFYRWVGAFNNEDKKDRGQKDRGTGL